MMILIVGATGVLGSATAKRLLADGPGVRAMARTPGHAAELGQLGAEIVQGDLRDPDSLRRACGGVDKVLATAHSLLGRGKAASKYIDDSGHKQLIDVAKAAGIQHFVYTSAAGVSPDHPALFGASNMTSNSICSGVDSASPFSGPRPSWSGTPTFSLASPFWSRVG